MLTIGRDLISNETVALTELVKNSFDADASCVLVKLSGEVVNGEIAAGTGCLEVLDDGSGMSADRIADTWLVPATDFRKQHSRSKSGRRSLGEKGVGRFAAAKLADVLNLASRPPRRDEVAVRLRWSDFDDADKFLDEIKVDWAVGDADVFAKSGRAADLWKDAWQAHVEGLTGSTPPERPVATSGTYLRMDELETAWTVQRVAAVRRSLARLISPFAEEVTEKFMIILDVPPGLGAEGIVEPPEELNKPHYRLEASVSADGSASGTMHLKASRKVHKINVQLADDKGNPFSADKPLACGPFKLNLRVWDRDAASLASLGDSVKSVRQSLDEAAGVSVYRDGFRVLPYGERGNDWLELDLQRVNNPTLRLSNSQIVGFLAITRDGNPDLVDQTNREGLVEGPAFRDLQRAVREVLGRLEQGRYDERPRPGPRKKGGLLERVDLSPLKDAIAMKLPGDTEVLSLVVDLQREIDQKTDEVGEALARYHRLATLGGLVDRITHEITQPLFVIDSRAALAFRDIDRATKSDLVDPCLELVAKLRGHLETISDQRKVAGDVVARIEPFGGRRRGRPPTLVLEDAIQNAVDLLAPDIAEVGATVEVARGSTSVTVDGVELQEVIVNLLTNSLHWLRRVPSKRNRKVSISIERNEDRSLSIIHEDSGPGVPEEIHERIFEPYFTTRDGGIGLGLAIAGEIVEDFYGGRLELMPPGPLGGARFRATLKRRVGA